jgi:hypothetical protein
MERFGRIACSERRCDAVPELYHEGRARRIAGRGDFGLARAPLSAAVTPRRGSKST